MGRGVADRGSPEGNGTQPGMSRRRDNLALGGMVEWWQRDADYWSGIARGCIIGLCAGFLAGVIVMGIASQ